MTTIAPTLTATGAISRGWEIFKRQYGIILVIAVVALLTLAVPAIVQGIFKNVPVLSFLAQIFNWLVSAGVTLGLTKVALMLVDDETPTVADLYSCFHLLLPYLGASILFFLIVLGGLILLIVPGIIWFLANYFYGYVIVDKGQGVTESLRSSRAATAGHRGMLFVLGLLLLGLNLLGAITVVGLLVTVPVSKLAVAYTYRTLTAPAQEIPAEMPKIIS